MVPSIQLNSRNKSEEETIKQIIQHLPEEEILRKFCEIFLGSIHQKTLQDFFHRDIIHFLIDRFESFKEGIDKPYYIKQSTPTIEKGKISALKAIDIIATDTPFFLVSLESIFESFSIKVLKKLHPITKVTRKSSGEIQSLLPEVDDGNTFVHVYIEFEPIDNEILESRLMSKLEETVFMTQQAHGDNDQMLHLLRDIKDLIKKVEPEYYKPFSKAGKKSETLPEMDSPVEWVNLIDWLLNDNFNIFGQQLITKELSSNDLEYKKSEYIPNLSKDLLSHNLQSENGQGLLNPEVCERYPRYSDALFAQCARTWKNCKAFAFDIIEEESPIKRTEKLMRLSMKFKKKEKSGHYLIYEFNFLGLLKHSSLHSKNLETPLIHAKMKYIFEKMKMHPNSYNYNEMIRIFTSVPKFELFRSPKNVLLDMVRNLLNISDYTHVHCFPEYIEQEKKWQLLVVIPNILFTPRNNKFIINYLKKEIPHLNFEVYEISDRKLCRLHLYFYLDQNNDWKPDMDEIETHINQLVKSWEERLQDAISRTYPGIVGKKLFNKYNNKMPGHYRAANRSYDSVKDIEFLEKLTESKDIFFDVNMFNYPSTSELAGKASLLKLYSFKKIDLIDVMPVLQNVGLYVIDQMTSRIGDQHDTHGFILSFRVTDMNKKPLNLKNSNLKARLVDLLEKVFTNQMENDPLNALVLTANLHWKSVTVLQAIKNYYFQLSPPYNRSTINNTLLEFPHISSVIFQYFETKFSLNKSFGDKEYRLQTLLPNIKTQFIDYLANVEAVSSDIILRSLFNIVEGSLRTNFYIPKNNKDTFISIKYHPATINQMPRPIPYREIFVYDKGMEGSHLRMGSVARGGLRWSDRKDDFRQEVLGLVSTQKKKNVVIVPEGSKGCFIIKKETSNREELLEEGIKQYKIFISGLLDITDNIDHKGQVTPVGHVLCYDDLDPYLVVAADKGTATFSDYSNEVSEKYKFWLSDGFASGGSEGYDHKKYGITAKGAWECVKLHFAEKNIDCQKDEFSVIGVGDMSGDVFGNGMLLSKAIRLQAAFNHIHIFLDPQPHCQKSWEERDRLFKLPKSSWKDYNPMLISKGGGIFDRKAKSIVLTPEIKNFLGTDQVEVNGEQLIHLILKAKADLLWLGGIGTYIKADRETHLEVGDQANDSVRINASECNVGVIGEGANLGVTPRARIELNKQGIVLNTDAIDNSAGVNMSDYEVNIKILLKQLMDKNIIKNMDERNQILETAGMEVVDLVLKNNQAQHQMLSQDIIRHQSGTRVLRNLITFLIKKNIVDPHKECIPDQGALYKWEQSGVPFSRSLLSVITAYVKMEVKKDVMKGSFLEKTYLFKYFTDYIPESIKAKFSTHIKNHKLKSEIIGTAIVNEIVNRAGTTFFHYTQTVTNAAFDKIAETYIILSDLLSLNETRGDLEEINLSKQEKYDRLIDLENNLSTLCIDFLQMPEALLSFENLKNDKVIFTKLMDVIAAINSENELTSDKFSKEIQEEFELDKLTTSALTLGNQTDIIPQLFYLHKNLKIEVDKAFWALLKTKDLFEYNYLKDSLGGINLKTNWEEEHSFILKQELSRIKIQLALYMTNQKNLKQLKEMSSEEIGDIFQKVSPQAYKMYFSALEQLKKMQAPDLDILSVLINRLQFLIVKDLPAPKELSIMA